MTDSSGGVDDWDEIHGFDSPGEYERFKGWIAEAIEQSSLSEVAVESNYSGSSLFDERWFRSASGVTWRLVAPEPPFLGTFEMVASPEER